jgi:hypothetical protein
LKRLLKIEFEHHQKINDKFDGSRFFIKNWAVTTGGAVLALSVTARRPVLAVIGGAVVMIFAYIETLYIYIQDHVIARCNYVEKLLDAASRSEEPMREKDYRFGVSQAFVGGFDVKGVLGALKGRPHIYILYLGLVTTLTAEALALAIF